MTLFKKYKLNNVIDEMADMLSSFKDRIEQFDKTNRICVTWVYHLQPQELKYLGINKPWECSYLHIQGNPNPPFNPLMQNKFLNSSSRRRISIDLASVEIEQRNKVDDEYDRIMSVANKWAKTVGAQEVLIFRIGKSQEYISMVLEYGAKIIEFVQLNKSVHGKLRDSSFISLVRFAEKRTEEIKHTPYIIER